VIFVVQVSFNSLNKYGQGIKYLTLSRFKFYSSLFLSLSLSLSLYIYIYIYIYCVLRSIWPAMCSRCFFKQITSYKQSSSRHPVQLTVSAFIHEYTINFQLFFIIVTLNFYKFIRYQYDHISETKHAVGVAPFNIPA
jgi:hypothetical protein